MNNEKLWSDVLQNVLNNKLGEDIGVYFIVNSFLDISFEILDEEVFVNKLVEYVIDMGLNETREVKK